MREDVMSHRSLMPLLVLIMIAMVITPVGQAQEAQNQAGIVIRYGDGRVATACVRFSEPSISGIELLQRAGVSVIAQSGGIGAAVCKISDQGCDYPAEDCFCQCKGGNCAYWAYQRLRGDRWAYSPIGASASQVQPGDVDGWAWGAGSVQSGAAPPVIALDQICREEPAVAATTNNQPPTAVPVPSIAPKPTIVPIPTSIAPTRLPTSTNVVLVSTSELSTAAVPTPQPTQIPTSPSRSNTPTIIPPTSIAIANTPTMLVPTSISVTITPQPQQAPSTAGGAASYLIFGILVLMLGGGIILALRRSRRS